MDMATAMPGRIPVRRPGTPDGRKLRCYAQKRKQAVIAEREQWIPVWQQVSEYVDPARGSFNQPTNPQQKTRQRRSRARIINGKATECVRVAAAGLSSHMTNKSQPWFILTSPYPDLAENYNVRVWLDNVTTILRDTLAKTNFYKIMPMVYTEDFMFGVSPMLQLQSDADVVRYYHLTAGTYAIGLDAEGKADCLWRTYSRSARQLKKKYGEDNLPLPIREACKNNPDILFEVQSLFERNPEAQGDEMTVSEKRPWREVVWIEGSDDANHGVLTINGFYHEPFVVARWNPTGEDVYSTSPCIDALGDIKELQYQESKYLKLVDLVTDPPLGLPSGMQNTPASLSPGTKTYLPATQQNIQTGPLYQPPPQALQAIEVKIQGIEQRIQKMLFYDLFLMMQALGDQTGRTAAEIYARRDERASILGPTVEIVSDDVLDAVIVNLFTELDMAGRIPPVPEELANVPIKIEYTSALAQAQKAQGLTSIDRLVASTAQLMQVFGPQVGDKIDPDQVVDEIAARVGAPQVIVRSDDMVTDIRDSQAQQQRMAQLMASAGPAKDMATAVKTLGEAVPEDDSLGQQMAEGMSP